MRLLIGRVRPPIRRLCRLVKPHPPHRHSPRRRLWRAPKQRRAIGWGCEPRATVAGTGHLCYGSPVQALLSAALVFILAQAPPSQPAFKSGVNVVEVDVVVTDKTGRPMRGLRQGDFEVFEDGKPVEVVTFVAVDLPQAPVATSIPAPDRSGASVASNDQPADGRVMLIVPDQYHVRFDAGYLVRTKAIARKLVERLGPSDQAAVIATSGRSLTQAEFTGDKARLVEAIDQFFPQSEQTASGGEVTGSLSRALSQPVGGSTGFIAEIKARWTMETLSNAAKALAEIPHRRKAILLVSEGLPVSVDQIISNASASAAWSSLRDFILTAQRSNVAVYPVDPCGLSLECSTTAQQNLRTLAEATGGFAVVNTNSPEASVERIVAENGTYYLLGYSSPARANDGRSHRISVRTRVPDVEVRARTGYRSPRRANKPATATSPLDSVIAAPIQTRGLHLRVAAVPAPLGASPHAAIVVAIELPAKQAVEAATIEFRVIAVDREGKVRAGQRFTNTFQPSVASPAGWARFRTHLSVAHGRYQIRVAAVGANKTQGSVFTEVNVPKFDGDLVLGGLSIVAPVPGTVVNEKETSRVLSLTPLANRDLPANVPIAAELPLRIAAKAASGPLTITTTLVSIDGSSVQLDNAPRDASAYASTSGGIYRVALPPTVARILPARGRSDLRASARYERNRDPRCAGGTRRKVATE